mgnify:CR=1 FL=1
MPILLSVILLCFASSSFAAEKTPKPDHLIIMIFDAMRPDFVDRFGMKNFKRLQQMSRNYPQAYVGHLFSETVVAHAVIPTGLPPRLLPWDDDLFWDKDGRLGKGDAFYLTGNLSIEQHKQLLGDLPSHVFLQSKLKNRFGGKVFAVGAKAYAASIFGGPHADGIVTFKKEAGKCLPAGRAVPDYVSGDDRFTVDCSDRQGTEMSFYPLDGARHVPGKDPKHLGGDTWVADVAMKLMEKEQWSALLLTFSGIDKMAHMLGEQDGPRPHDFKSEVSFENIVKNADVQLGRLLDALEKRGELSRTLIVVTADHGGQANRYFFGGRGKGHSGVIVGDEATSEDKVPGIEQLRRNAKVRASYYDSALRVWLEDQVPANRAKAVASLEQMSGVVAVYGKMKKEPVEQLENAEPEAAPADYGYKLEASSRLESQPRRFKDWMKQNAEGLLDSMASERSPDLVGFLEDDVGYGLLGDHGGAQEKVQRVPLSVYVPGKRGAVLGERVRHRDIKGLIEKEMGL